MVLYRKRPVVVEAERFDGSRASAEHITEWVNGQEGDCEAGFAALYSGENIDLWIDTLEGRMTVSAGDYVIRGVSDEFYPCKPEIFDATYENVVDL